MKVTGRASTTPSPHGLAALAWVAPATDITMPAGTIDIVAETRPLPPWHTAMSADTAWTADGIPESLTGALSPRSSFGSATEKRGDSVPGMAREQLAGLLNASAEPAASSVYRKLPKADLSVVVDGVGPLRFPVSDEQASQLQELGRRARFGRGEQTLTDPEVRDTWEIPKELVRVEWTEAFAVVLDGMRAELGLPPHCELTPELHSMLLYETGQFFVAHQDSEKDDAMVATLVVTLPSAHTGGEFVRAVRSARHVPPAS